MAVRFTDPEYLKREQYQDATNLEARQALHKRFAINEKPWSQWLFEQIELAPGSTVVDIGCGPANLWSERAGALPDPLNLFAGDLSLGMARRARRELAGWTAAHCLSFDAQSLPFPRASADTATAFHMLYHVPDLPRALAEIRRVLRPGGKLYAATNGQDHMFELHALLRGFLPEYRAPFSASSRFNLENAPDILREVFSQVEIRRYPNTLVVTDPASLGAYILSMTALDGIDHPVDPQELTAYLESELDRQGGALRIRTSAGLAIASL